LITPIATFLTGILSGIMLGDSTKKNEELAAPADDTAEYIDGSA
jgi:hypothetical protein